MTELEEKIKEIVKKIPKGKVATYSAVAKLAGRPEAARAVGMILKNNDSPEVPCHRVVRSDGSLGGYNGLRGVNKSCLLIKEGINIIAGRMNLSIYGVNLSSSHPERK